MRHLSKITLLIVALTSIFFTSCRKDFTPEQDVDANIQSDVTQTKLGAIKPNPFSFETVKRAIATIKQRKATTNGREQNCPTNITIYPTHVYVRFAPQNVDQLTQLEDAGFELFDVPLMNEIIEDGDFYQDPTIPDDQITYQYTLLPYGYPLPQEIPYTIIDQIYLFNEEEGDEQLTDAWSVDEHCAELAIETNNFNPLPRLCEYTSQHGDPVITATQALLDQCLSPSEVYAIAAQYAGFYEDDTDPNGNFTNGRRARFRPQGTLKVFHSNLAVAEPLKGVTVKSRNFLKLGRTSSDANGRFSIDRPYRKKAAIIVKFKNHRATTRGINGILKVWQYAFPVKHKLGVFTNNALQTVEYTFQRETDPHTETARKWVAATTMNAVWDCDEFNRQNNINSFPRLKIWLSSRITSNASAPMLNYVLSPIIGSLEAQAAVQAVSTILDALLLQVPLAGPALAVLKRIIELNKPDVTLRYGGDQSTNTATSREIYNTMIHEFSHATHYWGVVTEQPIRGGSDYWWSNIKYVILNNGYGERNTNGSERVAVIESWGFFAGNTGNALKHATGFFIGNSSAQAIRADEIRQLEFATVDVTTPVQFLFDNTIGGFYYNGWIPLGMIHDFADNGNEPPFTTIDDQVNSYSINGIFAGFRNNSNTVQEFKDHMLRRNGNQQITEVNDLVRQYGY